MKWTDVMNRVQQRVYEILEVGKGSDVLSKLCDRLLMILVLASILDVILGSVPEIDEMYGEDLRLFEILQLPCFQLNTFSEFGWPH